MQVYNYLRKNITTISSLIILVIGKKYGRELNRWLTSNHKQACSRQILLMYVFLLVSIQVIMGKLSEVTN